MTHAIYFLLNTMWVVFDPRPTHIGFLVDNVARGQDFTEHFELFCKYCVNIHETKIGDVNFNNFLISQ
jgi:hypothetical protein